MEEIYEVMRHIMELSVLYIVKYFRTLIYYMFY